MTPAACSSRSAGAPEAGSSRFARAGPAAHKGRMQTLILVGLGGAFGAICRYLLGVQAFRAFGPGFPYGTFAANLIGGLLMGVLVGVLALRGGADQERWRLLLGVGGLGGF